jgi:hypothetical protein
MLSSYQVVLWKQESFGVLHPLQIEFFRNLLKSFVSFCRGPGLVKIAHFASNASPLSANGATFTPAL